jgi:hypothetical protein
MDSIPPSDRRSFPRLPVHAAVGIETSVRKNRVGVTRNISAGGLLFHTASRFQLGERLDIRFRARPILEGETLVTGRVVRAWHEERRHDSLFPHVVAVQFDEPVHALEHSGDAKG